MSDRGEQLRDAADMIGAVADDAPEGDFDAEEIASFEAEFGEVPSLRSILRDIEQETRTSAILLEAHEGMSNDE